MKATRKHFNGKLQIIKVVAKGLKNTKFYAIVLVLGMLAGILNFSPVISSFTDSIVITSSGEISTGAYARSGSAEDIQAAVDWVAGSGDGIGNVYIPEGTFNFVEVGEPWMTVNIPAGVNLFGAPTERTSGYLEPSRGMSPNEQVVQWKTVLVMPYDVPGDWYSAPYWFKFIGDNVHPFRFSDIMLKGYKSIDPNSTMIHQGINIENVVDFRVDHSCLEHAGTGGGINIRGVNCRGVIDHCRLVNPHVKSAPSRYMDGIVGYGVALGRGYGDYWEDDVRKVLGHYTDYSVYIEDCYFEKWRHCIAANDGTHYVFRHNTIKDDFGFGSLDAHGWGNWDGTKITQVGTRAVEIYANEILDAIQSSWATMIRGGAGVAFNNTVGGGTYGSFIYLGNEADPEVSKCWCHDWWIWNNTMLAGCTEIIKYDPEGNINEDIDYFRHAPDTFNYTSYPYPHPLTVEAIP